MWFKDYSLVRGIGVFGCVGNCWRLLGIFPLMLTVMTRDYSTPPSF